MNKTNIEWCDYTWNPVTGCQHGCEYCYARRFAARGMGRYKTTGFRPTLHQDRLVQPPNHKKPARIFLGSMGDLFGDWKWYRPDAQIAYRPDVVWSCVLKAIEKSPQHTFICLTKNPVNAKKIITEVGYPLPSNLWLGTSITGPSDLHRVDSLLQINAAVRVVSWEPALESILYLPYRKPNHHIDWLIIGAQTGPGKQPPPMRAIEKAVRDCQRAGVPVFVKNNLGRPDLPQEWPEGQ